MYLEVELLDLMVILYFISWGTATLAAAPFYIPINKSQWFQFLHIFSDTSYFLFFFKIAILIDMGIILFTSFIEK